MNAELYPVPPLLTVPVALEILVVSVIAYVKLWPLQLAGVRTCVGSNAVHVEDPVKIE
jgi:hypothetical protein